MKQFRVTLGRKPYTLRMTNTRGKGNPNMFNGFQNMMREMLAQTEQRMVERFQGMLNAHKEEVDEKMRKINEGQESTPRQGTGGAQMSFESRHDDDDSSEQDEEEEDEKVRCTYKDFNGCHLPTYDGTPNPIVLHNWVNEMEMAFSACQCLDIQRTGFAVKSLKSGALQWWLDFKETTTPRVIKQMGWNGFLEQLKERFCMPEEIRQLEKEFLGFKKGDMTLADYNSRFLKLMSFSRRLVPDENAKVSQYIDGLPFPIQMNMGEPITLQQAMKRATRLVRTLEEYEKEKDKSQPKKRKFGEILEGRGKESPKKPKSLRRSKSWDGRIKSTGEIVCFKCGAAGHFASKCPIGVKCHGCGEISHIASNCPEKKDGGESHEKQDDRRLKGHAYQMVATRAREETHMELGKFS